MSNIFGGWNGVDCVVLMQPLFFQPCIVGRTILGVSDWDQYVPIVWLR